MPGDHLPTVRELAATLQISPGTVMRAYTELEREGIVLAQRGGGTMVSIEADDPKLAVLRQSRLSSIVNNNIMEVLSLGYNPEDLEASFNAHISRWRLDRKSPARLFKKGARHDKKWCQARFRCQARLSWDAGRSRFLSRDMLTPGSTRNKTGPALL